ncbi:hypothetical protein ACWEPC_51490, partial [Nonomuraea sp. NPDC004297]
MSGEQRKFELSMPQILGSALAAVTAAVAASYLGVAGTVIGAAVVSVASTIATSVYTHYLKQTGERVKQHTPRMTRREEQQEPEADERADDDATLVLPAVRRRLPWVRLGAATVLVFGVSMGSILAYQALAQQTVHEQVTGKTPAEARKREQDRGQDRERATVPTWTPEQRQEPASPVPDTTAGVTPGPSPS